MFHDHSCTSCFRKVKFPYHMVGTHKRIQFEDLMLYKGMRDHKRREGLKRLTQMSEAMGLYDEEDEVDAQDSSPTV